MQNYWLIRWRGTEEVHPSFGDALDRQEQLDAQGIAIRAGDLAALPLLRRFGVSAAARASCYLYTSIEEIDQLADALVRMSEGAKSG